MDWTTLLFSFNGRVNRARYWSVVLIYLVIFIAVIAVSIVAFAVFDKDRIGELFGIKPLFIVVGGTIFLVFLWSSLAIAIKRLHDRNKSGWWVLVFWVLPSVLGVAADTMGGIGSFVLNAASIVPSIWGFVEVACLRGTQGPNEYGPDPLGAPALAPAVS